MASVYCRWPHPTGLQRSPPKDCLLRRLAGTRVRHARLNVVSLETQRVLSVGALRRTSRTRLRACSKSGADPGFGQAAENQEKSVVINSHDSSNEGTFATVAAYSSIALGVVSLVTSITLYSLPGLIFLVYWVVILRPKVFVNNRADGKSTGHTEDFVSAAELKVVQAALADQQQELKAISESVKEITQEVSQIKESTHALKQSQTVFDSSLEDLQNKVRGQIDVQKNQNNDFSSVLTDFRESVSRHETKLDDLEKKLEHQHLELEKVAALQTPDQVLHTEEEGKLQSKQKKDSQPIVEVIQSENVETAQRKEASQPQYYGKSSDREPAASNKEPSDAKDFDKSRIDDVFLDAGKFAQSPVRNSPSYRRAVSVIEWGIEQTEKVDDALTNSLEYPKDKVRAKEEVKQAKLLIDSVIKSLETGKPYPSLEASTERACRMFQESLDVLVNVDGEDRTIARTHSLFGQALFLKGRIKKMIADDLSSTKTDQAEKFYGVADESLILCARQFREAILIVPEDESAYYNWALALELRAQISINSVQEENLMLAAIEKLDRLVELNRKPAYLVSLGDTLIRLADILEDIESAEQYYEDALELFDECLKSHPNDPDALEGLQRCEMELDSLFNS